MASPDKMDPNEEIVRLMVLALRQRVGSQTEAIQELSKIGFGPTRIAELLGTTANTVNVTLQKAKKRATPAKAKEKP
jgi:DNA-directed RNA polymerase specialized sigma24 family protein